MGHEVVKLSDKNTGGGGGVLFAFNWDLQVKW